MSDAPTVSVVIAARNASAYIGACIGSLLAQTLQPAEIIISDDHSDDDTRDIVRSFVKKQEERHGTTVVRLLENPERGYIARNRTIGTKAAIGAYIFYTDSDCIANRYWIEEGMRFFDDEQVVGVRGHTIYENSYPTIGDRITAFDGTSDDYATCNIAYRRKELERIGFFDGAMKYGREDTDVALKLLKAGTICFSRDMIVVHRRRRWTFNGLVDYNDLFRDSEVVFLKRYPDFHYGWRWGKLRILEPLALFCVFFPPMLLLLHRLCRPRDLLIVPLVWVKLIVQRIIVIRAALREKVLII